MKRSRQLGFLALTLVTILGVFPGTAPANGGKPTKKAGKRPNILYIMSDDHANAAIGAYGSWLKSVVHTPNLDRLAKQGMRFKQCAVTNSICTPSRAAILTSQYSHKNGVYTLADPINPNRQHLGHLLQAAGYRTAIIGKWHLHTDPTGFDYWKILPGQGRYFNPIMRTKDAKKGKEYEGYSTDVIANTTMDWIKQGDKEKPFFVMCHFKAPHRPWDPKNKWAEHYKNIKIPEPETLYDNYKNRTQAVANATMKIGQNNNQKDLGEKIPTDLKGDALRRWAYQVYMKRYLSCVAAVDENVGRILDFLEKEGLLEDTIIIYTSDQGFFLGEHGFYDKRFMLEPSLLTPFIVRYPREVQPGSVNNDLVLNLDFAPTLLDYAGAKIPADMQGHNLRPLLKGQTPKDWRTTMYYRYWMHMADHGVPAHYGVRTPRYSLIYYYGEPLGMKGALKTPTKPEWELYDRQKDPQQMNNVYHHADYAPVVRELTMELQRLRKEVGDER